MAIAYTSALVYGFEYCGLPSTVRPSGMPLQKFCASESSMKPITKYIWPRYTGVGRYAVRTSRAVYAAPRPACQAL
jgi:hypothetical protein